MSDYEASKQHGVYHCEICGQRILVLEAGPMAPICCGKQMIHKIAV